VTLRLPRSICTEFALARTREWLCTNGMGGYAMGSVAGSLERSYHGLLIEATDPPLGRTLRLAKLDPELTVDGITVGLDANAWDSGVVAPNSARLLESFTWDRGVATWTWLVQGARIKRRVAMVPGEHTTAVEWSLVGGADRATLRLRALGSTRSHHHTSADAGPTPRIETLDGEVRVDVEGHTTLRLLHDGEAEAGGELYTDFLLGTEKARGLGSVDAHRRFADITFTLEPGYVRGVLVTTEADPEPTLARAITATQMRASTLSEAAPKVPRALAAAADQFIVQRDGGKTVIAGYPWFGDWGRDTMIALEGLCLRTGRAAVAADILRTFARYAKDGLLPNRFPSADEEPEYNTVDATMWFFRAAELTVAALPKAEADALVADLVPVLDDVVAHHLNGTHYNIHVADDGLVSAGAEGVQLTWMDARFDGWVVTPRRGKPVEVNGLWVHGLGVLAGFRQRLGRKTGDIDELAARARHALGRFWNAETGCLYDVLDGPDGDDAAIRPNQLMALALDSCPLSAEQRASAVRVAGHHLLTGMGLRSLTPYDDDYIGDYGGPAADRDPAYHQGTVWGWLIGPWARARRAVGDAPKDIRADLAALLDHTAHEGVIGSVSEVFTGDAPFAPRGAPAQAWSVAELICALVD
jgi:predicted glycogen debranching enzyme